MGHLLNQGAAAGAGALAGEVEGHGVGVEGEGRGHGDVPDHVQIRPRRRQHPVAPAHEVVVRVRRGDHLGAVLPVLDGLRRGADDAAARPRRVGQGVGGGGEVRGDAGGRAQGGGRRGGIHVAENHAADGGPVDELLAHGWVGLDGRRLAQGDVMGPDRRDGRAGGDRTDRHGQRRRAGAATVADDRIEGIADADLVEVAGAVVALELDGLQGRRRGRIVQHVLADIGRVAGGGQRRRQVGAGVIAPDPEGRLVGGGGDGDEGEIGPGIGHRGGLPQALPVRAEAVEGEVRATGVGLVHAEGESEIPGGLAARVDLERRLPPLAADAAVRPGQEGQVQGLRRRVRRGRHRPRGVVDGAAAAAANLGQVAKGQGRGVMAEGAAPGTSPASAAVDAAVVALVDQEVARAAAQGHSRDRADPRRVALAVDRPQTVVVAGRGGEAGVVLQFGIRGRGGQGREVRAIEAALQFEAGLVASIVRPGDPDGALGEGGGG